MDRNDRTAAHRGARENRADGRSKKPPCMHETILLILWKPYALRAGQGYAIDPTGISGQSRKAASRICRESRVGPGQLAGSHLPPDLESFFQHPGLIAPATPF